MLRRTFRFILRFGFFILVLLVIIVGGLALLALVGPEGTVNFKKLLDAGWWFTSIIRWLAIAGIILYLPKFAAKRAERYARELEGWIDAYDNAEAQGATFETLQDIQARADDCNKMRLSYEKLLQHHRLAGCLLICFELAFVQFPHLI